MKLIWPLVSRTAHSTSSMCAICALSLACAASSSSVMRLRRRFRSIVFPRSTSTTGSPSSSGPRRRGKRNAPYEKSTVITAIVPPASIAPVTEKSFWVTPCWIRSPSTTSRIRSKGSRVESSRRPTARVTNHTKTKRTIARTTMSISGALGPDGDRAVDCGEQLVAVIELHVLRAVPDVGRVHLELEEENVLLPGRDAAELEGEAAVAARLADRGRLDGVDRDSFRPA